MNNRHNILERGINIKTDVFGKKNLLSIAEVILYPLIIPIILWALGYHDIFLLKAAFPWLVLIPTLTSSRYGTWYGLLSLLVFSIAVMIYVLVMQPELVATAIQILVACLVLVILVGEMVHRWKESNSKKENELIDCRQNTAQSEQALQLLNISYSQLEEELVTTTQSLSSSLRLLEVSLEKDIDKKAKLKIATNKMRSVLQQYDWLESAVFYYVDANGSIHPRPMASIGVSEKEFHFDPMIKEVIRTRKAIKLNSKSLGNNILGDSQLQAAIPLVDLNNHLWGVMAIGRIAPSAFIRQNLNLLALLCNYVANLLSHATKTIPNYKLLNNEIHTAAQIVLTTVKSLTLMCVDIPPSQNIDEYLQFFVSKIRGANRIWHLKKDKQHTLVILLPLFNINNATQWNKNIENNFIKQFGLNFKESKIRISPTHYRKENIHPSLQEHLNTLLEFDHAHIIR